MSLHNNQFHSQTQGINMKSAIILFGFVALTSSYPMLLLEDEQPIFRVPRQMIGEEFPGLAHSRQNIASRRQQIDQETAADTPYGHAVSSIINHIWFIS